MKKSKFLFLLLPVLLFLFINYFFCFNLSIGYLGGAFAWGIFFLSELIILALIFRSEDIETFSLAIIGCVIILIFIIGIIAGSNLVTSSKAYSQIGKVEEASFVESIVPIDNTQIPTVDEELALKQAEKKLGEERGLGSKVEIGDFTLQQVDGKLTFVAPLDHRGFMKWWNNKTTPGYITVSATDPNQVELVQELNGEKINLKYLESSYFGDDLLRHLRSSGYRTTGLTDFTFELDENGRPFWTVTTYENIAIWNHPEATGILTCDAQTGETKWYSKEDTPKWVDKIQPEEYISDQIDNYGKFEQGFWNSIFAQNGIIEKTPGLLTVYNNGKCYYYTGMTSIGKDDATTGFMLVDTRTKEAKFFKMAGATESSAQSSAEGKVQEKKYNATLPVPINVQGIPTYFMTLKDKAGLIKAYAMVNIENYAIVATAETIEQVQKDYISAMLGTGNDSVIGSNESYLYDVDGKVTRISAQVEKGSTTYYIILNDDTSKLYVAAGAISNELPITREGDSVKISFIDDNNGYVDVAKFDNLEFTQQKSEDQEKKDSQNGKNISEDETNKIIEVDPNKSEEEWNKLTDEEKAKLLEESKKQ